MTRTPVEAILNDIQGALEEGAPALRGMCGDPWLLASALQKSIRRNEPDRACEAAASFWRLDRVALYKRLHVVALEDCGVGDPAIVMQVLTATAAGAWRRKLGDERVALHLTRLLCGAVKNRMADELFIQAERDVEYQDFRLHLARVDDDLLAEYIQDTTCPIIERAIALWLLSGTKRFPSDFMPARVGSPERMAEVLHRLALPPGMADACLGVVPKTPWPLSVFFPLIWQEVERHREESGASIIADSIPRAADVDGLPIYAADMFTRVGQASIRELQKAVRELQPFSIKQIALTLFYLDGGRVDRRLTNLALDEFRERGEIVDVEGAGLGLPEYLHLRECLSTRMPLFDDIRTRRLHRHLEGAEWAAA